MAEEVATLDSSVLNDDLVITEQPIEIKDTNKQGKGKLKQVDFQVSQVVAETSPPDSSEPTILEDTVVSFQDSSQVVAETSTADDPELTIALDTQGTTFVVSQ